MVFPGQGFAMRNMHWNKENPQTTKSYKLIGCQPQNDVFKEVKLEVKEEG